MRTSNAARVACVLAHIALSYLSTCDIAIAGGGFQKVEQTTDKVVATLIGIAVSVVTIAVLWAGFKMLFQRARLEDVAHLFIGGTFIGGAAAFAAWILN